MCIITFKFSYNICANMDFFNNKKTQWNKCMLHSLPIELPFYIEKVNDSMYFA